MTERIAVDFDNTITEDDVEYWNDERPEPDADIIEWVNEQYNAGHTIIIWTARQWTQAGQIAAHCTEWGLKFHGIRCSKGSADQYIDDKAKRPQEILEE